MQWLLLDCDYLCHRAYYSRVGLEYRDSPTGVIFGFFQDLISLQEFHDSKRVVFCFDSRINFRKGIRPEYKSNREEKDPSLVDQIRTLRRILLPRIGYTNIFHQKGYEADDVIASLCYTTLSSKSTIIVSADEDLYQLLGPQTMIWHPRSQTMVSADSFSREYGVQPLQWIDVKAIAGCSTDCVAGIDGVGVKRACQFLNGTLNPNSKAFQSIVEGQSRWERNRRIVRIPYPGIRTFELEEDRVSRAEWNKVCKELGMKSLRDELGE